MSELSDGIAIRVNGVSKDFHLMRERKQSVKSIFTNLLRGHSQATTLHALRDIDIIIKKGEFLGIVGRNGSGKTTLLKILAGIYQPTRGNVEINGRLVPFIELGVGFNPELTGRENVYLNGAMMGFSTKEVKAMYNDIVEFAEIERFMDQKLKNYSSGMQVRLAFSLATRSQADILLIDEVLAVGDAAFQRKCYNYFKSLKRNKKTVVFVSHDMNAVREYCDRAILIDNSRIVDEGKAERITQSYLHLFNTEDEELLVSSDEEHRWGNGWARVETVNHNLTSKKLTIALRVQAKRDIENLVYGFRIRRNDGEEITGTNSSILGFRELNILKGQQVSIYWEMPNVFSSGEYFIEPSLIVGDGATVCDWWNEAVKFRVVKDHNTSYPVTPDIKFTLKESNR